MLAIGITRSIVSRQLGNRTPPPNKSLIFLGDGVRGDKMTNNSPFSIVAVNDTVEVLDVESADTQRGHFAVGRVLGPSDYISPENAAALYLDTLGSDASICTVRSKLNQVARWFNYADYQHCDWHLMRYDNVVKFIAHLKESGIQTVTINAYLCALKGVAQTAWNLGQVSDAHQGHQAIARLP